MTAMLNDLQLAFEASGWACRILSETSLRIDFRGESGAWPCVAHVRPATQQIVFYSIYPEPIPAERRGAVMELMTRANIVFVNGCFDLDLDDGELRYRTCADPVERIDPGILSRPLGSNVATMDRFFPAIRAVVRGELSVAEALKQTL